MGARRRLERTPALLDAEEVEEYGSREPSLPCRGVDPEAFFSDDPAVSRSAQRVCWTCPVRERCLEGAIARRERWGVWGGYVFVNGKPVDRKRAAGRPRKDDVEPAPPPP